MEKKEKETHEGLERERDRERERKRRRDSHAFKKIQRERDHTKGVSIPSTIIHTRAHLDLIV